MTSATSRVSLSPAAVLVAGLLSLSVAMGIGRFAFTPMLPLMLAEGQLDIATAGWVAAANYVGYLLGAMTASRLKWSATRLCAAALLMTVVLTAAMALPVPAWVWAAMRLLAGACSAWAFVGTSVWCLGALARLQRSAWGSSMYAGVGLGIAAAGMYCLVGASLGAAAPSLWMQLAVFATLLCLPVWLMLRRLDAPLPAAASLPEATAAPAGLRGLAICYGVFGFGYILPATFLPVLARSVVEDPRLFGLAWPVFGTMAAVSALVAGVLLRRATRLQVWAVSNVLMGVGVLLPSLWLAGWSIALSALLVGGTFMIVTLAGVQEIRARATGDPTRLVARMTSAFAVGQIAGPVASSLLLHVPTLREQGLDLALQAGALALFLAAAWLWWEDKARSRH